MTEYHIRPATVEDAPIVAAHRNAMFQAMNFPNREALALADERFLPWVQDKMAKGEYVHWFATDADGNIVAGGGAWLMEWPPHAIDQSGRRANLLNVYTDPAHRRQGLAGRITQTILDYCQGLGIRTFILHASAEGRGVYEALGFKATNEMRLQR